MFIDLHIHTLASDGRDSPAEVVRKAKELGLSAIAITDHDTLKGLPEAQEQGDKLGLEVIRGCELSINSPHGEVHMVALWIPQEAQELEKALEQLRENRARRNEIIVQKLNDMNIPIKYEDVLRASRSPDNAKRPTKKKKKISDKVAQPFSEGAKALDTPHSPNSVGRPHIATVLFEQGYVSSIREAFSKYIGNACPAFEPKKLLDTEEIMHLLMQCQATVCLAHPGLIPCDRTWLDGYVLSLKNLGLSGIEAYHSEHDADTTEFLLHLAQKHDLGVSGGSDYHGAVKPHISLGCGRGNLRIAKEILDALKERRRAQGFAC